MVLPFAAMTQVRLRCPHCAHEEARLAAGVKRGMETRCASCRRVFTVDRIERVIGSATRSARKR
jgi:transposase-like protein